MVKSLFETNPASMKTTLPISNIFKIIFLFLSFNFIFKIVFAQPDYGKTYINVTKSNNGGMVEPGDTIEIRATFVVRAGTYDSCAFFDAVPAGTTYIPGTLKV